MMEQAGLVFNLQKFSLHDGPGIRTTVFLQGCPLRCGWCSNPESQNATPQLLWDSAKCLACLHCITACPKAVLTRREGRIVPGNGCVGCGACVRECPGKALELPCRRMAVPEVLAACLQDRAFYEGSGGGVTLSGGEPLFQPDFCLSLLEALQGEGLHTALETTGFVPPELFQRAAAFTDLFLFDLKHGEEEAHRRGTGVSNRLILENLAWAAESGKEVLPRIPVIPGFNDRPADAESFCRRLRAAGLSRAQLLPFHQFGEKKYEQLGRDYAYAAAQPLRKEGLEDFRQAFLQNGVEAFF